MCEAKAVNATCRIVDTPRREFGFFEPFFSATIAQMFRLRQIRKLTSIFVVAFICLNAGGAVCVAYCQTFDIAAAESEHCPLKKISNDCDGDDEQASDSATVLGDELDCCPMTVSFFAGPIEKSSFSFDAGVEIAEVAQTFVAPRFAALTLSDRSYTYRGPPLDRRTDRLKHCLIRI
jgi:hypothetical protein